MAPTGSADQKALRSLPDRLREVRIADDDPCDGVPTPTNARSAWLSSDSAARIDGSAGRAARELADSSVAGACRKRYSALRRTASSRTSSWPLISLLIDDRP